MPCGRIAIALLILCPAIAFGQYQAPSDYLMLAADKATTWSDGPTNVVQLEGNISIKTDRATMSADKAVIWLTPLPGTVLDQQRVEIVLMGNATLEQQQATRSGDSLLVTTQVRGVVRLASEQRANQDLSDRDLYRDASSLRPVNNIAPGAAPPKPEWIVQRPWLLLPPPASAPATQPITRPTQRASFKFGNADTVVTPEGKVAAILSDNVAIVQIRPNGDIVELQADRVVLFTPLTSLQELNAVEKLKRVQEVVHAAYLEGDVRINFSPRGAGKPEQRLRAKRVYYDLATDRAVLTDAVIHTIEPQTQTPVILRAELVRQLSIGEYKSEGVELTTSSFAVPSYSIKSDRAYVREYDSGDPRLGARVDFAAANNTFSLYHLPIFYWPWAAGSFTDRGFPLRQILFGSSRGFGPGVRTEWGFFESIGRPPPPDLDISYRLDYFGDRGPAGGVDAKYGGALITETTKQPWNFEGDFTSYFISDHGEDNLGRKRLDVEPDESFRYRALWQHQHFFPENWQLQLRAGIVSDPTFLEQFFRSEYNNGLPSDVSAYLKHQYQTEAFTLGFNWQPNDFVTTADLSQEQFEVEHLPEIGYYRIGDSFGDDRFTFFSANNLAALHFNESDATLAELGFRPGDTPGLPSLGTTGVTGDTIYRGDFRQEIDYPFSAGQFRFVPYVMGRYTAYNDSPDSSTINRIFVGTGLRINTAFWKVDNTAFNKLLDIHRIRHVIEPELHLFTSVSSHDQSDVFIYDEPIDKINDITGAQIALRQRWQTKRGGPGQWRSVDFFTLNIEGDFFANRPDDNLLEPRDFRGLFFSSLPEASIPRNAINADALWRVSDSTALLSDMQFNLDEMTLATTSIGLAAQRESRLSYFLGLRYINGGDLNSTIASFAANYQLSSKYTISFSESVELSSRENQTSSVTVVRKFDRFYITFNAFYDAVDDESGFRFGIFPEGLGYGLSSDQLQQALGGER